MAEAHPSGIAPRQLALDLLQGVWEERMLLAELEAHPHFAEAPPEVQARAGRLARTTLRLAGRADAAMKPFLQRNPRAGIRALMRLAIVEMFSENEAAHGVVNAAVSIARREQVKAAPMVNAVLRRVAESGRESWDKAPPQRLPNWLRGRLGAAYGNARVARMEAAFEATPPVDLEPKAPGASLPEGDILPTGSLRLARAGQISALPGYQTGDWWVQDAAAALPARLLAARPGERVLDLCAAPGGKTLQLAAAGAQVTALDVSETRLARLRENLDRTGLRAEVVAADALEWTPKASFDAILLDAPCSATGTIRRHPDLPFAKDPAGIKPLVALQSQLIDRSVEMLAPGGRLVFCTCSLLPEEGEAQYAAALERHTGLAPDASALAALDGLDPDWRAGPAALRTTPEMWPERGGLDGFFIAALSKT
ncbi:RsmB/NOP family class I SAM-dependent RNA methyltransferase [Tropicimonas sp. IMCC6043]|uniref:RsmB/NOP family class I SAM-dependent RNA methyltransferase n=1 Tax=Tropicimonas sp. IMCC6043 TaxID=2510645 RepID=UPI00101B60A0|nr:RsmB/NOP family class I SAM-dependent RNA methyltransferase [Tropicimonas sp. IMCC6043]RYH09661.1 methyltransferase domain-containing protein [Tropicimonas sp. IMCC6043]